MDAMSIANTIAEALEIRDDVAVAEVTEPAEGGPFVTVTTQGGVAYYVEVKSA